jgi:hypothetical protein
LFVKAGEESEDHVHDERDEGGVGFTTESVQGCEQIQNPVYGSQGVPPKLTVGSGLGHRTQALVRKVQGEESECR